MSADALTALLGEYARAERDLFDAVAETARTRRALDAAYSRAGHAADAEQRQRNLAIGTWDAIEAIVARDRTADPALRLLLDDARRAAGATGPGATPEGIRAVIKRDRERRTVAEA